MPHPVTSPNKTRLSRSLTKVGRRQRAQDVKSTEKPIEPRVGDPVWNRNFVAERKVDSRNCFEIRATVTAKNLRSRRHIDQRSDDKQ